MALKQHGQKGPKRPYQPPRVTSERITVPHLFTVTCIPPNGYDCGGYCAPRPEEC